MAVVAETARPKLEMCVLAQPDPCVEDGERKAGREGEREGDGGRGGREGGLGGDPVPAI
jgi:hypothetical protein